MLSTMSIRKPGLQCVCSGWMHQTASVDNESRADCVVVVVGGGGGGGGVVVVVVVVVVVG